jgi:dUTP pyrophosphatase
MSSDHDEFVGFCLCHTDATAPVRKNTDDAGYDLASVEDVVIPPSGRRLISTGLKVLLPAGTYGRVAPRSGMSVAGTSVGAGVIDLSYRGIIKVLLFNHNTENAIEVKTGDRIAQLVIEVIKTPAVRIVTEEDLLSIPTTRGEGGFGSTGR